MLNRLQQRIHYCYRLQENDDGYQEGIETFLPPAARWLNVLPVSGELLLASGGELNTRYLRARMPFPHPEKYYEGDRIYIRKDVEEPFDPYHPAANYVIRSVLTGHAVTEILMERLVE